LNDLECMNDLEKNLYEFEKQFSFTCK